MGVEPSLRPLVVRQHRREESPECVAVRPVGQVGEFVGDDVFQHPLRRENEPPVDVDGAVRAA